MMSQHKSHPRSPSTALLWRWFGPPSSLHITEELLIKDSPAESKLCDTAEERKLPFSQPHYILFWLRVCSGAQSREVQLLCNLWNPQNSLTNSYKQLEACYFCAHCKLNILIDTLLRSNCPDQLRCHFSDIFSDTVTFFTHLIQKWKHCCMAQ